MTAAVYMANTISPEWNEMSLTFNLAMLVMLLCVAAMYFIQTRLKEQDAGATKNSLIILTVDCILYFAAILMAAALALFFIAIYADSVYYHERFSLAEKIRAEVGKTDSKAGRKDLTVGGQQKNQ